MRFLQWLVEIHFSILTSWVRIFPSPKALRELAKMNIQRCFFHGCPWDEFEKSFDEVGDGWNMFHKNRAIRSVVQMFWERGRFDEARMAARYWCAYAENLMVSHEEDYREHLQELQKYEFWHLGREGGTLSVIGARTELRKALNGRQNYVTAYRDAHLTLLILEWSKLKDDKDAKRVVSKGKHQVILTFNERMAKKLGIKMSLYDQMRFEAEMF